MSTKLLLTVREQVKARLAERTTLNKERQVRQAEADSLVTGAEGESRDLDAKEAARFRELRAQLADIDGQVDELDPIIEDLQTREAELVSYMESAEKAQKQAEQWADRAADPTSVDRPVRVRSEARTYTQDSERRGTSFYRDLFNHRFNADPGAGERLERHSREARLHEAAGYEARDVGTGAFAGLTVPQYLTDMVAPLAIAASPTVQICNRHPLPADGMSVNISRITTGTGVAAQSSEADAVNEVDIDDTLLTVNVRTYAGQQDVSRQALERSTGVDAILTQDLVNTYWMKLDDAILNGAGTNGTHLGIRSTSSIAAVAYAATTPAASALYPKLAQLISTIQSGVFMGVSHFIMAPRRWWWISSQVGTSFPFLNVPQVNQTVQAGNIGGTDYIGSGPNILGVPVVLDGNLPLTAGASTNEDVILGVTARELHLWEDTGAPMFIRAEQPGAGTLQVKFVVYGYSAFTAGRYPGAHGTISSTGLVTPTF
jgi:HK97 family phage major capsid protein